MTEFFRTPKGLNIGGVKIVFGAGNPPSDGGVQSGWIYFNGLNGVWYRYNGARIVTGKQIGRAHV